MSKLLAALLCLWSGVALGQSPSNPPVGSVWTYQSGGPAWLAASGSCPSIMQYGGSGDGTTDNVAALTAAFAAQPTRACVSFPPGRFKLASTFTHNYSGAVYEAVTVVGSGADVTEIIGPANGSGLVFNLKGAGNSIHIRDMSLTTPSACVGCVGLSINQAVDSAVTNGNLQLAQNDITGVSVYGDDRQPVVVYPSGTHYWGTGILLNGVSSVNLINTLVQGVSPATNASIGVRLVGVANRVPIVFNFSGFSAYLLQTGILYDKYVQGVTVNQSNLVGVARCILANVGGTTLDQLSVTNSSFNCNQAIDLQVFVADVTIVGNTFISGQGAAGTPNTEYQCVNGFGAANLAIVANSFEYYSGTGVIGTCIKLYEPTYAGVISDNSFKNFSGAINVGSGATGYTIANNSMVGVTTPLVFSTAADMANNRFDIPQVCDGMLALQFGGASTGITYGANTCQMTFTGQQITLDMRMVLTSKGTATGSAQIANLPRGSANFNPTNAAFFNTFSGMNLAAGNAVGLWGLIQPISTKMDFMSIINSNQMQGIAETAFTNTSTFAGRLSYRVNYP